MGDASVKETVDKFRKNKNEQVVLVLQGGGALGAYQVERANVIKGSKMRSY